MPSIFRDGIVSGDLMREADSVVGRMDSSMALSWLREREDTLGVYIGRAASAVITGAERTTVSKLSEAQRGLVERGVIITAIGVATALATANHQLWRDVMRCSTLAGVDPLLSIRRRIVSAQSGESKSDTEEAGASAQDQTNMSAQRARLLTVERSKDADDDTLALLALTLKTKGNMSKRYLLDLADGEELLKLLCDRLARSGNAFSRNVWPLVCGHDAKFDSIDPDSSHGGQN